MKEVNFAELGYFTETQCKRIKLAMDGTTHMNFVVGWCNVAGNCILNVQTEYDTSNEEIRNFFLHCALSSLGRNSRENGR